jgi:hypothetical protein
MTVCPGWVWNHAYCVWTPRGYVFVNGYWDYSLTRGGILFAPVVFNRSIATTRNFVFQPRVAVNVHNLSASLFARPPHPHYFFGDFFGDHFRRLGFQPWYMYGPRTHDPLFNLARWENRHNPTWFADLHAQHLAREEGRFPRPARTLAEQNNLLRTGPRVANISNDHLNLVTPLSDFRSDHFRLSSLSAAQRAEHRAAAEQLHDLQARRTRLESAQARGARGSLGLPRATATVRKDLQAPRTPGALRGRAVRRDLHGEALSVRHTPHGPRWTRTRPVPKVDPKVASKVEKQPAPRVAGPRPRHMPPRHVVPVPRPKVKATPAPRKHKR